MATFTNPGDRNRLIEYLQLSPCAEELNLLDSRMLVLEQFDLANATDYVTQIVAALDELDTLKSAIATLDTSIKSLGIAGEYNVNYFEQGKGSDKFRQWSENIAAIRRIFGYENVAATRLVRS